jgi:hypothetical protein
MATAKKSTSSPKKATSRAKTTKSAPKKRTTARKRKPAAPKVEQPTEPTRYVARNATHYEYGLRLDRQEAGKKRFDLKPRGQRGDFAVLQDGDLQDPMLVAAIDNGSIEVITTTEAAKIAKKQTTNQQRVHPALAMIRNEYGEEYDEGSFSTTQSFEDQGVVVAHLNDGQIAVGRGGIDRTGGNPEPQQGAGPRGAGRLRRPGGQAPQTVRTRPADQTAANTDAKARIKGLGGPSAGVPDGIQVTVAPTQQT